MLVVSQLVLKTRQESSILSDEIRPCKILQIDMTMIQTYSVFRIGSEYILYQWRK